MSSERRVAVVLFNLGGPDRPEAVRPFLYNLFSDPKIIALPFPLRQAVAALISRAREKSARANYDHMGGASPLLAETQAQAQALETALRGRIVGDTVKVFVAMRYWRPLTQETAAAVAEFAPTDVVLLPLYPQYSTTTSGSSLDLWRRIYRGAGVAHEVCCYPDETGLLQAHADRITTAYEAGGRPEGVRLLFSAHGLPEKLVFGGDPYQWQIERTCSAVVARLGGGWDWSICYQSRVGPLKWLGPSTPEAIQAAAAEGKGVLVVPVAFVSEHVETLVELDRDYAEVAARAGCPAYLRVPALGVAKPFIDGLAETAVAALARGSAPVSACGGRLCPARSSKCPAEAA